MAVFYLLLQGGSLLEAVKLLTGLNPSPKDPTPSGLTFLACGHSVLLISLALVTAFATAFTVVCITRRIWAPALGPLAVLGRLLFAAPVTAGDAGLRRCTTAAGPGRGAVAWLGGPKADCQHGGMPQLRCMAGRGCGPPSLPFLAHVGGPREHDLFPKI